MERTGILALMGEVEATACRAAYDEVMASGIKRQHEPPRIVGDLLKAEIAEKQARSIKYQMTIANCRWPKTSTASSSTARPINEALVRDLSNGGFLAEQRNAVLIGGTGTGKRPSRHRDRQGLHPRRRQRALLQRGRSRQPARQRGPRRPPGANGRLSLPPRLRDPR